MWGSPTGPVIRKRGLPVPRQGRRPGTGALAPRRRWQPRPTRPSDRQAPAPRRRSGGCRGSSPAAGGLGCASRRPSTRWAGPALLPCPAWYGPGRLPLPWPTGQCPTLAPRSGLTSPAASRFRERRARPLRLPKNWTWRAPGDCWLARSGSRPPNLPQRSPFSPAEAKTLGGAHRRPGGGLRLRSPLQCAAGHQERPS